MLKHIYLTTKEHDYLIICKENWFSRSFQKAWKYDRLYLKKRITKQSVIVPHLKEYEQKKGRLYFSKILGCYVGNLNPGTYPLNDLKEIRKRIGDNFKKGGKVAIKDKFKKIIILSQPIEKIEEVTV